MPAVDHRRVSERGRRHWYALPKYILWEWCMLVMPELREAPFTSSVHGWMAMLLLSESLRLKMYCTAYFSSGVLCLHGRWGLVEWGRILKPLRFVIRALISLNRGICQVLWGEGWTNLVNVKTPPHTLVHLCRSLHEKVDAQLIGELARLLLCYHPLVRSVRHEDLAEIFRDTSNVRLDIDQDIGRGSSMPGASGYTY